MTGVTSGAPTGVTVGITLPARALVGAGVMGETTRVTTGFSPVARTLAVADNSYSRRQLGFLRFGEYAGSMAHFDISLPHLPAGERNDVEGDRYEVLNSYFPGAEEHEIAAGVAEVDEEIEKEVEEEADEVSAVHENFSAGFHREIRQLRLAGATRVRSPPLCLPKRQFLPLNLDLHPVGRTRSGEDLSQSCRPDAPLSCRPHIAGAQKQHLGAGGSFGVRASGAIHSESGEQSIRGLGRVYRQSSAIVGGSFTSDRQIAHLQRHEAVTPKEKAARQDWGGSRRTRRSHRRGSRQRAQAVIELVSKREASATSRTASINVCDRLTRSYAEVTAQIPEGTHHEDARREAPRRHRGVPSLSHRLPRKGRRERCLCCLAKDHQVKDCWEPLKCLECGHSGHRRSSCPHRTLPQRKTGAARQSATGFSTCLVGEVCGSTPTWEHILAGL